MKLLLIILAIFQSNFLFAQRDWRGIEYFQTVSYLKKNNIPIGLLIPNDGFIVHYNCDSVPFLKKISDDTIKIWTASISSAYDVKKAKKLAANKKFSKTQYLEVMDDGRIWFTTMHETIFLHRNDSLFEFGVDIKPYQFKLIFTPKMFVDSTLKVKLPSSCNYKEDEVELENQWTENNKKCYTIRINNQYKNDKTSYSYTFSEDIVFLNWENCIR